MQGLGTEDRFTLELAGHDHLPVAGKSDAAGRVGVARAAGRAHPLGLPICGIEHGDEEVGASALGIHNGAEEVGGTGEDARERQPGGA